MKHSNSTPQSFSSNESLNSTNHNTKRSNSTHQSFSSNESLKSTNHNTKRLKRIDSSAFTSHSTSYYRNATLVSTTCYNMYLSTKIEGSITIITEEITEFEDHKEDFPELFVLFS